MTYYDVRVCWPSGGYGGGHGRLTKEQADAEVERMKRMGYGTPKSPIHMLRITETEVVRVVDDMPERENPSTIIRRNQEVSRAQ